MEIDYESILGEIVTVPPITITNQGTVDEVTQDLLPIRNAPGCTILRDNPFAKSNIVTWMKPAEPLVNVAFDLDIAKKQLEIDCINEMADKAAKMVIETDSEAAKGLAFALQARTLCNNMEKTRKSIVAPHISFQKAVKQFCDAFTQKLKDMENSIIKKIDAYQDSRKEKMVQLDIADTSFENLCIDEGTSKVVMEWDFEVEDPSLVPNMYMIINEKLVKQAIKSGVRKIPGIKIFEKQVRKYRVRAQKGEE